MFVLAIIAFVLGAIALVVGIIAKGAARRSGSEYDSSGARAFGTGSIVAGVILGLIGVLFLFFSSFYQNGVGEAKVLVNAVDRQVEGSIVEPSAGFRSPLQDFVEFDTLSQELLYAGGQDGAPSYTGGTVNGKEVTVSVGGVNGGSTQANVDISITYSVDPGKIEDIYKQYRSQERFTKQVVEKTVLSVIRSVPTQYTATEFRGAKKNAAADEILKQANDKLEVLGVQVDFVNIQDVRYPKAVEAALTAIEEANQNAQKAEADKRTAQVNAEKALIIAQGDAAARIEAARGEAEANRLLTESLTPQVLEQRKIDALTVAAENGNLIIDGSGAGILLQK